MALGLGFGCCCQQCALLQNCDTEATITTTSDLSAYSVGDVLRRDDSEGGGCWEILSLAALCSEPETFTVDVGPFVGATACAVCLAGNMPPDGCQSCGGVGLEGEPVLVDWDFSDFTFGNAHDASGVASTYLGNGVWQATRTVNCGGDSEVKVIWHCQNGNNWWATLYQDNELWGDASSIDDLGGGVYRATFSSGEAKPLVTCNLGNGTIDVTWHHTPCGGGDGE